MADGQQITQLHDIYLASFLKYRGIELTFIKQGSRVVFEVPATDGTYRAMAAYQTNPTIPVLDLVQVLRRVRGQMLDARDGEYTRETAYESTGHHNR